MDVSKWQVSATQIQWIPALCRRHGIRVEKLLGDAVSNDHFSLTEDILWTDFIEIVAASGRYFSISSLRQAGAMSWAHFHTETNENPAQSLGGLSNQYLKHWGPKGSIESEFPVTSALLHHSPGTIRISITMLDQHQACQPLFYFLAGQIEALTSLSIKRPAQVEVLEDESSAIFEIHYAEAFATKSPAPATHQTQDPPQAHLQLQQDHDALKRDYSEKCAELATIKTQLAINTEQIRQLGQQRPGASWLVSSSRPQADTLSESSTVKEPDIETKHPTGIDAQEALFAGKLQWVSPATLELLGYTESEFLQLEPEGLISEQEPSMITRRHEQSDAPGYTFSQTALIHKSGHEQPVHLSHLVFDNPNGEQLTWWFAESIDTQEAQFEPDTTSAVTNARNNPGKASPAGQPALQNQLRMAQKTGTIGQLSSGIVHDFNNLLVAIMGYADLALDQNDPTLREQYLNELKSTGMRGQELTQQILAFARGEPAKKSVVSADAVINNLSSLILRLLPSNIDVQISTESHLDIFADQTQIEQVLMNLVVNAGHAMAEGGTLKIDLSRRDAATLSLSVSDTGCGMDETTRDQVFEPFFTTKAEGLGTGLGLSVAFEIIAQHHGSITVSSAPGDGTRFEILLPLETVPVADRQSNTGLGGFRPNADRGNETILVVEDNEPALAITRLMLTSAGYTVIEATNAAQAIDIVQSAPDRIELALIDVVLPTINGYSLAEQISHLAPDLAIILTTGYPVDSSLLERIQTAEHVLLSKPFDKQQLCQAIRSILDEKGAASITSAPAISVKP